MGDLLHSVDTAADLRRLDEGQLAEYCEQVRRFIIDSLARAPGHLASSLGTVELTVALHYVFDTPNDKLIWDVGHQAYAHKIITGRRDEFATLRKLGGIAGFPRPEESEFDPFVAGHASNSISVALGFATANRLSGRAEHVAAIIGDGAMTGGLAFEGLNNAGVSQSDLLVVLNDNRFSIDKSTGGLSRYLVDITTSRRYNRFKARVWNLIPPGSPLHTAIKKTTDALKGALLRQSNFFESFGFRYFGPVDGHDVVGLVKVLRAMKHIGGPKLLHILTEKGRGYSPAQMDLPTWHAPGKYDPATGIRPAGNGDARWQDVFGETLVELARENEKIVGITPAMPTGSSLNLMMEALPARAFDVGIAEGHAVTFAGGLAAAGMVPFCTIYSSFLQRAYDNVIHDVAIENLPVVLCVDRGGLVGEDGTTHQGVFDIAALRPIPNLIIASPMDEIEMRNLMYTASRADRPFVIRYPRGCAPGEIKWRGVEFAEVPIGRGRMLRDGKDVAVISFGPIGRQAFEAVERSGAAHFDLRFAKPLDQEMLHSIGKRFARVVTIEDGSVAGGVGESVKSFFAEHGYNIVVRPLGVPDKFIPHGSPAELYAMCGYDAAAIADAIEK